MERVRDGVWEQKRVRGERSGRRFDGIARYETSGLGGSCDTRRVSWGARAKPLRALAG